MDVRCLPSASSLSVNPDLFGPGRDGVLVGDQQNNRVTVLAPNASRTGFDVVAMLGANNESQLSPGDVEWAQLDDERLFPNANANANAIVVSTGGNAVIVYRITSITGNTPNFASESQTYSVGTAPASVTVADINSDSIPDLLVANQGSDDISVLFGSYASNGEWISTERATLQSGGDGPIGVAVRDLNGDRIPDLVVTTNGTSRTVTSIGLSNGSFDDLQPQTLFDLGGMVEQPPTFVGESGVGFAVITTGNLVRFDLSNPSEEANVVFSGSQVVAAQALSNDQIVAAVADGTVIVLRPLLGQLIVSRGLFPLAGTPALPSSLVVVQQADDQLQVLVSSRGSDRISVFIALEGGPVTFNNDNVIASGRLVFTTELTARFSEYDSLLLLASALDVSITRSRLAGSSSFGDIPNSKTGLTLSSVSSNTNIAPLSPESMLEPLTSSAAIVSIKGSAHSAVAVLGFGPQQDNERRDDRSRLPNRAGVESTAEPPAEEPSDGHSPMPRRSQPEPVSDLMPLARFVIGLDEASQEYRRNTDDSRREDEDETSEKDPWKENVFHRPRPAQPPLRHPKEPRVPASEKPKTNDDPPANPLNSEDDPKAEEQALLDSFWRQCPIADPPSLVPCASVGGDSKAEILAALLASAIACDRSPDQATSRDRRSPRTFQPWRSRTA